MSNVKRNQDSDCDYDDQIKTLKFRVNNLIKHTIYKDKLEELLQIKFKLSNHSDVDIKAIKDKLEDYEIEEPDVDSFKHRIHNIIIKLEQYLKKLKTTCELSQSAEMLLKESYMLGDKLRIMMVNIPDFKNITPIEMDGYVHILLSAEQWFNDLERVIQHQANKLSNVTY